MIVVFDSNVWISALRFGGVPMTALRTAYLQHTIAFCSEIEAEVLRTLESKFGWRAESAARLMNSYLERGLRVEIPRLLKNVCRDKDDDMVLECAVIAQAKLIISGDKDLLALSSYAGIKVISPVAFISPESV